jgi:hypothetical protein
MNRMCPKCGGSKSLGAVLCRVCRAAMKGSGLQVSIADIEKFEVDRILARMDAASNGSRVLDEHSTRRLFGMI